MTDSADKRVDQPTGTEFVGHEWDGIEELDTPLPRWWLIIFYGTVIWGIAWTILYPAWPLINSATEGVLGYSSRAELAAEMEAVRAERAPLREAIVSTPLAELRDDPQVWQAAVNGGSAAFRVYCVQCHGSGAAGGPGYPNLNDDDWLWGGDLESIAFSIEHGIRNPDHDMTRQSVMPAFGADGILSEGEIANVAAYVQTLSGAREPDARSARGAETYAAQCALCHGDRGRGDQTLGAPNLSDRIWLYGGDEATIRETITYSRAGVMPRWGHVLDEATVRMLAAYVHSLGGGVAAPQQAATTEDGPDEGDSGAQEAGGDERT